MTYPLNAISGNFEGKGGVCFTRKHDRRLVAAQTDTCQNGVHLRLCGRGIGADFVQTVATTNVVAVAQPIELAHTWRHRPGVQRPAKFQGKFQLRQIVRGKRGQGVTPALDDDICILLENTSVKPSRCDAEKREVAQVNRRKVHAHLAVNGASVIDVVQPEFPVSIVSCRCSNRIETKKQGKSSWHRPIIKCFLFIGQDCPNPRYSARSKGGRLPYPNTSRRCPGG